MIKQLTSCIVLVMSFIASSAPCVADQAKDIDYRPFLNSVGPINSKPASKNLTRPHASTAAPPATSAPTPVVPAEPWSASPSVTTPQNSTTPQMSITPQTSTTLPNASVSPDQMFVIHRSVLVNGFPKAVRMARETYQEKARVDKALKDATEQYEQYKSQGKYSELQLQQLQRQWQDEIDKLSAEVDSKVLAYENELRSDIESAVNAEALALGVSRERIRFTDEYSGDGIDITGSVMQKLPSSVAKPILPKIVPTKDNPNDEF